MEGHWLYKGCILWPDDIRYIEEAIARHNILSLSQNPVNTLMWTHYAESHKGLVIGVELVDTSLQIFPIVYTQDFHFDGNAQDIGIDILTKKFAAWEYEEEYRVFTDKEYVPVSIRQVILGVRTDQEMKSFLSNLFSKYHPDVEIIQIKESDLDAYRRQVPET